MFECPFPILYAADVERSVRFYCEGFDFEQTFRWPEEGPLEFAFLRLEPLGIGIGSASGTSLHGKPLAAGGPASFELCFYTEDVDAAVERLTGLGARLLKPPADQPWGERLAYVEDPDGIPLHLTAKL